MASRFGPLGLRIVAGMLVIGGAMWLSGGMGSVSAAQGQRRSPRPANAPAPTPPPAPVEEPARPAWSVHAANLYLAGLRMRELAGEHPDRNKQVTEFDGLTAAQVTAKIAPERAALERDLRADVPTAHPLYRTLEAFGALRGAAAPSVPVIIELLDRFPKTGSYQIPYVCQSMKALTKIAPASPDVITAATRVIDDMSMSRGVCHTCGCALELLQESGPAARPIAGPVLQKAMANPRFITTYDWQLGRALKAVGLTSGSEASEAVARSLNTSVLPGNRAGVLRALAAHADATPGDRKSVREAATKLLYDELSEVRIAAAETLGSTGPDAVPALMRAMEDWHFAVRVAAAKSLGKIGRPALPAAGMLAAALDPFQGCAAAAGAALVAIGPGALPAVEAQFKTLPAADHARPVLAAVMLSLRDGYDRLDAMLANDLQHGPSDAGFVLIEPVQMKTRGTTYQPGRHRIRLRFSVLQYGTPQKTPDDISQQTVTAWQPLNSGVAALAGRRAGDHVRVLLSPDIAEPMSYATSKHRDAYRSHVAGTTGYFDVTIERVCEPQIWTLFRNGGIFGDWRIETSCRD